VYLNDSTFVKTINRRTHNQDLNIGISTPLQIVSKQGKSLTPLEQRVAVNATRVGDKLSMAEMKSFGCIVDGELANDYLEQFKHDKNIPVVYTSNCKGLSYPMYLGPDQVKGLEHFYNHEEQTPEENSAVEAALRYGST
jgi:hypothetical protein